MAVIVIGLIPVYGTMYSTHIFQLNLVGYPPFSIKIKIKNKKNK